MECSSTELGYRQNTSYRAKNVDRRKNYSFAGKEGKTGRGYYRRQGDSRTLFNPRGNHRFVIRKRQIMEIYCKFAISNTIKETAVQRVNIFQ